MICGIQYEIMPRKSKNTKVSPKTTKTTLQNKRISVPSAIGNLVKTSTPDIRSAFNGDGRVRIRHREYIADVYGSVAFAAVAYAINPGIATSFPWLSVIAANYESYKFNSLCFQFSTEKPTSVGGSLMMAIDFDANDGAPTTKSGIMAYHNAVRCPVWSQTDYVADKPDLNKLLQHYVRSTTVSGTDLKTYDVGNLFVCVSGCADTTALGELYVMYDVELITPQL